jgi:hypothetical protein
MLLKAGASANLPGLIDAVQVGTVSTPTANVAQSLEHCPEGGKLELLVALLGEEMAQVGRRTGAAGWFSTARHAAPGVWLVSMQKHRCMKEVLRARP